MVVLVLFHPSLYHRSLRGKDKCYLANNIIKSAVRDHINFIIIEHQRLLESVQFIKYRSRLNLMIINL